MPKNTLEVQAVEIHDGAEIVLGGETVLVSAIRHLRGGAIEFTLRAGERVRFRDEDLVLLVDE